MKHNTGKSITQKILIVLITLVMLTVSIPKPVQADIGGILLSPVLALATGVVDGIQWVLEWAMLGKPNDLMNTDLYSYKSDTVDSDEEYGKITITKDDYGKISGSLFGLDAVNIPDIKYTPENIFANRIPALDVNFIKPSVTTGDKDLDQQHNIAMQLQPVIASWYVAIRTLAVVGLLSVLVYLGIRILITSIAADKAKYKKILMDWLVAVILIFALHYIMSLALTAAETLTALINDSIGGNLYVTVEKDVCNDLSQDVTFKTNLTNYVRFMVQSEDFGQKVGFFFLYLMLVIYNVRFTWTYLKRVVNMAFLTMISPIVALTYPIDKMGDGKAQAFDLWIKEFTFNAILQPLHLLLYTVLLGTATQLAASNPLYAIVSLGFILAAEKLLKQMFKFNKAGAGTVGSLAGAAGVSALANKALMSLGKNAPGKGGGKDKVRTNDKYTREGKNEGANKDLKGFDKADNQGLASSDDDGGVPPPPSGEENAPEVPPENNTPTFGQEQEDEMARLQEYFDNTDNNAALLNPDEYQANLDRMQELEDAKKASEEGAPQDNLPPQDAPDTTGSPNPKLTGDMLKELGPEPESWKSLREADKKEKAEKKASKARARQERMDSIGHALFTPEGHKEMRRKAGVGAYKAIRGVKAGAKTAAYSAARGTLKAVPRAAMAVALGTTAGVIAATGGDGEKAIGAAATAGVAGLVSGGSVFENTVGKVMKEESIMDNARAAKYGSVIDARNAKADKEYLRSKAHQEEYEKYFKKTMTKQEFNKATKEYRECGITDTKTIRKALKLEQKYKQNGHDGGNEKAIREKVQNIAQGYDNVDKAIFRNKEAKESALKNWETQLTNVKDAKQKRAVANEIFQGYVDWRNA